MTSHPDISHLTFIGSRPIAHAVCTSAAKALIPVTVELGGKDASIVLDDPTGRAVGDAEMKRITSIIMRGVFQSAGQNCIGIERVIAMPKAYDRLLEMLGPRIQALKVGNDLVEENIDVGAMVSPASFERLEGLIRDAEKHGAKLIAGGRRVQHKLFPKGHYFQPTLLVDVTPEMRIAQEELFAPVCVVMRAASVDDAIHMANSTAYGLGSGVFGSTTSTAARIALEKVIKELKAGMVAVNDFAAFYAVQLPFGGVKGSGYGRFAGEEGLRALCNTKAVCRDRWLSIIKTTIPGRLDYPMRATAWDMGKGVVEVGYGDDWQRRIRGIRRMIGV